MVPAAFFDMDRTILEGSSLLALARPLRHEGMLPLPTFLRAALKQVWFNLRGLSDQQLGAGAAAAAAAVAGVDAVDLNRVGKAAIPRVVMPRVYVEARRQIEAHQAAGHKVFLVSAAPIEIVREVGRLLGVDDVAGSVSEIDGQGKYTGKLLTFCHGPGKADAVARLAAAHGIDLSKSTAYGDALGDVAMLASVGKAVAVNPDARLRKVARVRGWEIRQFRERAGPGGKRLGVLRARQPKPRKPRGAGGNDGLT